MIESKLLDLKNQCFAFLQDKLEVITKNSFILSKIDTIILFFMSLTLFASSFMASEKLGAIAIVVILLTIAKLCTKKSSKIVLSKFDAAIIIYFIICFISTINSELPRQSIHGFLKTVIYILYYFCAANYFQTNKNKIRWFFFLVSGLCCIEGIIAIYQNFSGVEQISSWQDTNYINPEDAIARAYGTLKPYNPNLLGGYLVAGISYVIGFLSISLLKKEWKTAAAGIFIFLVCALAILFTGSRGAYLGLGATVAGVIGLVTLIINTDFSFAQKLKSIWHKIVISIIGAFALILIAVPKITKRILSIFLLRGDSSTSFRMNVYHSSWHMFCDNWFFCIGSGNQTFREIYGLYMITGFDALSTYSVPLEIAVESGIFGFLAFAAFIGLFLFDSVKFIKSSCDTNYLADKAIVCSAILIIIGVMTHGLFDTIYFRPQVQFLFWTMIAMSSAVILKTNNKEV